MQTRTGYDWHGYEPPPQWVADKLPEILHWVADKLPEIFRELVVWIEQAALSQSTLSTAPPQLPTSTLPTSSSRPPPSVPLTRPSPRTPNSWPLPVPIFQMPCVVTADGRAFPFNNEYDQTSLRHTPNPPPVYPSLPDGHPPWLPLTYVFAFLFVDVSGCDNVNKWHRQIRLKEIDATFLIDNSPIKVLLQSFAIQVFKDLDGYEFGFLPTDVVDFTRYGDWEYYWFGDRYWECLGWLSLFDVAIMSGDLERAKAFSFLGIPQRFRFKQSHFCKPFLGLIDQKAAQSIEVALHTIPAWFSSVASINWLTKYAIASKNRDLAVLASSIAMSCHDPESITKNQIGEFLFSIRAVNIRNVRLLLEKPRIDAAVATGVNLSSVCVDPCVALGVAIKHQKYFIFKRHMNGFVFHTSLRPRQLKWREGQTLLQMAILCGQIDVIDFLIGHHCEATGLTSGDLNEFWFDGLIDYYDPYLDVNTTIEVSINKHVQCMKAACLAYKLSKHRYQIVIVQMARWWCRKQRFGCSESSLIVNYRHLVDRISNFANAVPALPEIVKLDNQEILGRSQWRINHGGQRMNAVKINISGGGNLPAMSGEPVGHSNGSNEIGEDTLVSEGDSEPPIFISPMEAEATTRALWEASIEHRLNADSIEVNRCHNEKITLGKLNRIPKEVRRELIEGPSLQTCRAALLENGYDWKLPGGGLIFVHPDEYELVIAQLNGEELHPDHIVFAESVEYLLEEALDRSGPVWMRTRKTIDLNSTDIGTSNTGSGCSSHAVVGSSGVAQEILVGNEDLNMDWLQYLTIQRSFYCLEPPPRSSAVTNSTTCAHCPHITNPRGVEDVI